MSVHTIVANNIKKLRKELNVSVKDISEHLLIDESVYRRIENGEVSANDEKLWKISQYFNVSISRLFEGIESNIQINSENSKNNSQFNNSTIYVNNLTLVNRKIEDVILEINNIKDIINNANE
jgi:transcriptional regulator with XRE-family HTH domain